MYVHGKQFNSIREDHILIFPDYNPSISICLRFSLQNTLRECFNLALGGSTAYEICTGRPDAGVSGVVDPVEILSLNKFEWLINTK